MCSVCTDLVSTVEADLGEEPTSTDIDRALNKACPPPEDDEQEQTDCNAFYAEYRDNLASVLIQERDADKACKTVGAC